jgi:hypothetical protein
MDENQLGQWMTQEYAKVNQLALHLAEHVVLIPTGARGPWLTELGIRFDHFAAHLRRMMAIAAEDGYLLPVLEKRPTLSKEVERLRQEHDQFRRLMDNLHDAIIALKPDELLLIRDCCARVQAFLGHVQRHQEHETHMVQYTLNQDIGTDH